MHPHFHLFSANAHLVATTQRLYLETTGNAEADAVTLREIVDTFD
jgi:hypothetical protein